MAVDACPISESAPLIIDVGFNVGQDTTAHLEAGYHVVAVEANPMLCDWARRTSPFREALESGRMQLINRAIVPPHEKASSLPFYIAPSTERSRLGVCNSGHTHVPCKVQHVATVTCATLLRQHPNATYVKIDVEGADGYCVESIAEAAAASRLRCLPRYMSVESNIVDSAPAVFMRLADAGYRHFKYVDQSRHFGSNHSLHGAGSGACRPAFSSCARRPCAAMLVRSHSRAQ